LVYLFAGGSNRFPHWLTALHELFKAKVKTLYIFIESSDTVAVGLALVKRSINMGSYFEEVEYE
jgi:hypothetical protein